MHFVAYLKAGNYFGVDMNERLLDAGYTIELSRIGLQDRLPRNNLICRDDFDLSSLDETFDYVLAQPLFTHLTFNRIRQCLGRLAAKVTPSGVFFATFFELPEVAKMAMPFQHEPGGIITHGAKDPYHYRFRDLQHAASDLPWLTRYVGDWHHPRGQRIVAFVR